MPDRWHEELTRGLATGEADLRTWWTELGDPLLDSLIDRATRGNLDVAQAVDRILEARARLGIAAGEFFPDVDGTAQAERSRVSEGLLETVPPGQNRVDTLWSVGGDAFWEMDLWGRIRRSTESASANLEASIEDYRDVLVSLYAEVASTYVNVRSLQARVRSALKNVETQRGSLRLTVDRRDAGIGSDLDVSQAELNLATTESFVPLLRQALAQAIHRLGVLLGEHPTALSAGLSSTEPIPGPPDEILVDLPVELLRQRPDVRRAERALAAQTALIGAATADLYPTFSLAGAFTIEALTANNHLFNSGNRAYAFGPFVRWNVFDGGRVRNNIRVQDARTEEAGSRYEQTVLRALEDVENSMVAYVQESGRRDSLVRSVTAAQKAVELVTVLYKTGLTDFQNVLDTERSLFQQEDQLDESRGQVTRNLISIYRALGGGWGTGAPAVP